MPRPEARSGGPRCVRGGAATFRRGPVRTCRARCSCGSAGLVAHPKLGSVRSASMNRLRIPLMLVVLLGVVLLLAACGGKGGSY
jgi:hypothetical protein